MLGFHEWLLKCPTVHFHIYRSNDNSWKKSYQTNNCHTFSVCIGNELLKIFDVNLGKLQIDKKNRKTEDE